jgi:beta-lactamase regulating signal transducer with metallopeptidase domain
VSVALFHLALASAALLVAAAACAVALARWRTRPSAGYRLVIGVIGGSLALAATQVAAERSGLELLDLRSALVARPAPAADILEPDLREPTGAGESLLWAAEADGTFPESGDFPARSVQASAPAPERAPTVLARLGGQAPWVLVLVWLAGVVGFLVRAALRIGAAGGLLARSRPARDEELLRAWRETVQAWPYARAVELRVTGELDAPACFGLFRRAILLPRDAQPLLEPACLRQVLLHELIHLERRDAWAMCLTELARALFWFHPAAWWLYRRAEELRELSCDAQVVARTGRPRTYARGLVAFAERIQSSSLTAALPSWSGSKSQFSRRIEMLLQSRVQTTSVSRGAKLLLGACLALCAGAQLALATAALQERTPEPRAAPLAPKPADSSELFPNSELFSNLDEVFAQRGQDEVAPLAPEDEEMHGLGYSQGQDPAPPPPQIKPGDPLARATELVQRALARNPGDEDLRQAIELLQQARAPRATYRYARPDDAQQEELRRFYLDSAKHNAEHAERLFSRAQDDRRSSAGEAARRQLEERSREDLDRTRERAMSGAKERNLPSAPPPEFEDELRDTLRLLDQQRAELDMLRGRIESLRSRARGDQPVPDVPRRAR